MTMTQISSTTRQRLEELGGVTCLFVQADLEQPDEAQKRKAFLEELNRDFAALQSNPTAWREEQAERKLWEQTLGDELPSENKK